MLDPLRRGTHMTSLLPFNIQYPHRVTCTCELSSSYLTLTFRSPLIPSSRPAHNGRYML